MNTIKPTIIAAVLFLSPFGGAGGGLFALPCRLASGAAIGNASVWQAPPVSLTLTHPVSGESLTANAFTGSPAVVYIYRVDAVPMIYSGTCASGSMVCTTGPGIGCQNDRYFGVFVAGTTTYTATYNYNANPWVNVANEPDLLLTGRNNNSVTPWVDLSAAIDMAANTLTKTGESAGRSEYLLGNSATPLPIELISFTIECKGNSTAQLNWVTASETNNDYFTVERDKAQGRGEWEAIGTVKGAGNSSQPRFYSFIDADPLPGANYYRLKQTDFNGQFTYSDIKGINCLDYINIILIYPNPAISVINYQVSVSEGSEVTAKVMDVLSRNVIAETYTIEAGITLKEMNVSTLAAGMYLLQVSTDKGLHKSQKQFIIK